MPPLVHGSYTPCYTPCCDAWLEDSMLPMRHKTADCMAPGKRVYSARECAASTSASAPCARGGAAHGTQLPAAAGRAHAGSPGRWQSLAAHRGTGTGRSAATGPPAGSAGSCRRRGQPHTGIVNQLGQAHILNKAVSAVFRSGVQPGNDLLHTPVARHCQRHCQGPQHLHFPCQLQGGGSTGAVAGGRAPVAVQAGHLITGHCRGGRSPAGH
jgi:hypothetical protein